MLDRLVAIHPRNGLLEAAEDRFQIQKSLLRLKHAQRQKLERHSDSVWPE